jgi:hypothetical protein
LRANRALTVIVSCADWAKRRNPVLHKQLQNEEQRVHRKRYDAIVHSAPKSAELAAALREIHGLLESYAPTWYTEAHEGRIVKALGGGGERVAAVLTEMCKLLNDYAPAWYTKKEYQRVKQVLGLIKKR